MTDKIKIKVAVVEDWPDLRATLTELLSTAADMEFIGACADGEEAIREIPLWQPDIAVMDINLPKIDGIECVRQLKERLPATEFMMLTIFEDHKSVYASLLAGATGYLVKKTPPEALLAAIRELHEGGSPMSPLIARKVIITLRKLGQANDPLQNLTRREDEILRLLATGKIYKEIAESIGISAATVRNHLHNIYQKLHVRTKTEAVRKFLVHEFKYSNQKQG